MPLELVRVQPKLEQELPPGLVQLELVVLQLGLEPTLQLEQVLEEELQLFQQVLLPRLELGHPQQVYRQEVGFLLRLRVRRLLPHWQELILQRLTCSRWQR